MTLRFSRWVANLVLVQKKNGEISLCVDFGNLNKVSLKDNYPLPNMDQIIQRVVGSERISTMDGFSSYNQVKVLLEYQEKTTFTTPWGTFMYANMSFGLMNAGATFERAMDISFADERETIVVIYMDGITVYSRWDKYNIRHLERVFIKCRKYGISLNPRKLKFTLKEGKLLGHIISKEGIRIDPDRVKGIMRVEEPRSKKEI